MLPIYPGPCLPGCALPGQELPGSSVGLSAHLLGATVSLVTAPADPWPYTCAKVESYTTDTLITDAVSRSLANLDHHVSVSSLFEPPPHAHRCSGGFPTILARILII